MRPGYSAVHFQTVIMESFQPLRHEFESSGGKSFRSKLLGIKSVFHCQPNLNTVRKSHRITFTQEQKFDAIVLIVPLNKLLVYTGALLAYLGDKMVVTTEWPNVL